MSEPKLCRGFHTASVVFGLWTRPDIRLSATLIRCDRPNDSAERRAVILRMLTQWIVFWRSAGIPAC